MKAATLEGIAFEKTCQWGGQNLWKQQADQWIRQLELRQKDQHRLNLK